ncbi:MAG: hypothetical protein DRQ51_08580 [Gammaproteobacteria bacterium]|nr:MAG: hypothetical protein DRQ51_08580 [Gammaproteobacteria bacterium]
MEIEFSNSFIKNLNKLSPQIKTTIKNRIKQISIDPKIGIPLKANLKPYWKLRYRDYRIVYSFNSDKIFFYALNHRSKIYKNL